MLIVDVYNALQTSGVLPAHLAGIELEGLARLISRSRYASRAALLVCDGKPHSESLRHAQTDRRFPGRYQLHTCDIVYAGAGNDADSLIERLIAQDSAPARLTVVSTDRRIRKAAARRGASSLSSQDFLVHLAADDARPRPEPYPQFAQEIPLDPYSLAHWMREFGYEPEGTGHRALGTGPKPLPEGGVGGGRATPATTKLTTKPTTKPPTSPPPSLPLPSPSALPQNPDPLLGDPHLSDPLLLEALRHWGSRMRPDELDMRRWLEKEPWLDPDKHKRPR